MKEDEQFRILCIKLKETDSKCQALVILVSKLITQVDRMNQKFYNYRSNKTGELKKLRQQNMELQARNITLKQENAELIKFQ